MLHRGMGMGVRARSAMSFGCGACKGCEWPPRYQLTRVGSWFVAAIASLVTGSLASSLNHRPAVHPERCRLPCTRIDRLQSQITGRSIALNSEAFGEFYLAGNAKVCLLEFVTVRRLCSGLLSLELWPAAPVLRGYKEEDLSTAVEVEDGSHSAAAAAMGFYYQSLYGLFCIVKATDDDAAVCLERLDDVEVKVNGQTLLNQLKHSLSKKPKPVTISSVALWKTLKAWIDVLPRVNLNDTRFQLVTVAPLSAGSPLEPLLNEDAPRTNLLVLLADEAQRVLKERETAATQKKPAPHSERAAACAAYLKLSEGVRQKLLSRVSIQPAASDIVQIGKDIADALKSFPPDKREKLARRLIEWWDLQVVHSFCGMRERVISMLDVQLRLSEIAGELHRDEVLADFQFVTPPDDHAPPSLIAKQLELVGGTKTEIRAAEREEWRARSQRHKWISERVDMAGRITLYDLRLVEAWNDKHALMVEQTETATDSQKRSAGLEIFRWSFNDAITQISPFAKNWNADYYVRGCYQFLAVDLRVGWHPDFEALLRDES